MKFFKNTIILAVILVLAGFSYWYFVKKKGKEKEEEEKKAAYLFEQTDKDIARVTLNKKGEPEIVLEKEISYEKVDDGEEEEKVEHWYVRAPIETGGDKVAIEGLLGSITESKKEEVVWENLDKSHEYGLDDPEFSIRFSYAGEDEVHGIDFGIENLDRSKIFASVKGKDYIYAVPIELRSSLEKSLFDMRDKKICPYKVDDIVGITYASASDTFILEKEGDEWYFLPDRVKASKTRVEIFTGNLRWGDFIEVVEEKGTDLKKYGLIDRFRLLLTFKNKDGSVYMFVLGDDVTENNARFFYATRSNDNMIFQVNEDLVSRLYTTKFELKDRSIFPFETDDVVAVQLEKEGKRFSFEKKDEDWFFQDNGEKVVLDYKIDNIVRGIITAEYEEREPVKRGGSDYNETGIENAIYEVKLIFKDERPPIVVRLTEKNKETNKCWLTPDGGQTMYYTSGYFLANFPESREELE